MKLGEGFLSYERRLSRTSRILNNIGLGVIVWMVFLTVADVAARRFFNSPITGAHELQQFSLMIAAFFTWGYCQTQRENITVTFISDLLPKKFMSVVDVILNSAALAVFGVLAWRMFEQGMRLRRVGAETSELRIPEWPFLGIMGVIGIALFVLILTTTVARNIEEASKK